MVVLLFCLITLLDGRLLLQLCFCFALFWLCEWLLLDMSMWHLGTSVNEWTLACTVKCFEWSVQIEKHYRNTVDLTFKKPNEKYSYVSVGDDSTLEQKWDKTRSWGLTHNYSKGAQRSHYIYLYLSSDNITCLCICIQIEDWKWFILEVILNRGNVFSNLIFMHGSVTEFKASNSFNIGILLIIKYISTSSFCTSLSLSFYF